MRRLIRVSFVLLPLLVCAEALSAQVPTRDSQSRPTNGFSLEQNYPNPFNPETTIPFTLGEELFAEGRPARVTLRVFNILSQLVARPVALRHPSGEGVEVNELEYTQAGRYEAFWNGQDLQGRQVASGMYLMQLTVNGRTEVKRMVVTK